MKRMGKSLFLLFFLFLGNVIVNMLNITHKKYNEINRNLENFVILYHQQ